MWGLAVGGADGVKNVFELLRREFEVAMALSGAPTLADITADLVVPPTYRTRGAAAQGAPVLSLLLPATRQATW